jgi:uncharacterized delta-60 repeat protein
MNKLKKMMFRNNREISILSLLFVITIFANSVSALDGETDTAFISGRGINAVANDITVQSDGKIVMVGRFNSVVGIDRKKIVRLLPNGNLDASFNPNLPILTNGANLIIVKLLVNDKLLISGDFVSNNSIANPINKIARLNSDGSVDNTFSTGVGANSKIFAIYNQPNGKIIVAGRFTNYNGTLAKGLVRLNEDGSIDSSFTPPVITNSGGGTWAITVQTDGKILIGGLFTRINGINLNNLARLNEDGTVDSEFIMGSGTDDSVNSIVVQPDGKIIIGGSFSSYRNISFNHMVRIFDSGGVDNSFSTNNTQMRGVSKISLQPDGKLIVVASFPNLVTVDSEIGRLNTNGTKDETFITTQFDSSYTQPVLVNGKILIAADNNSNWNVGIRRINENGSNDYTFHIRSSSFASGAYDMFIQPDNSVIALASTRFGAIDRGGVARLNPNGELDESFYPNVLGTAITSQLSGKILVGGVSFETSNGTAFKIKRINADGSIDPTYSVNTYAPYTDGGSNLDDLATQIDGKVIAVGRFEKVNDVDHKSIVRLNIDGNIDENYNPNLIFSEAKINRVIIDLNGKAYIAGRFVNSVGTPNYLVFRLNTDGTVDGSFNFIQTNYLVNDIAVADGGKVYIAGAFSLVNSIPTQTIARFNNSGVFDSSFTPPTLTGFNGSAIYSLLPQKQGKVIIGGVFDKVNGVTKKAFIRLNANGSYDNSFVTSIEGSTVYQIIQHSNNKVLLSGEFGGINGAFLPYIAQINVSSNNLTFDFDGDSKTDISIYRPSLGQWWYLRSSDGANRAFQFGSSAKPTSLLSRRQPVFGTFCAAKIRPSSGFRSALRAMFPHLPTTTATADLMPLFSVRAVQRGSFPNPAAAR